MKGGPTKVVKSLIKAALLLRCDNIAERPRFRLESLPQANYDQLTNMPIFRD
jgi:hypothetical protein